MIMTEKKEILGNKYLLEKTIGSGSYGKVFLARNLRTQTKYAVKRENNKFKERKLASVTNKSTLDHEYEIYSKLRHHDIKIPKLYDYYEGTIKKVKEYRKCKCDNPKCKSKDIVIRYTVSNYMVLELMGPNLGKLFEQYHNYKFDLELLYWIGFKMVSLIENLHNAGYVHRDLKPENFVVNHLLSPPIELYLIDFGFAYKWEKLTDAYKKYRNTRHTIQKGHYSVIGTARYMSINIHNGLPYSWRDDLESIGYILAYFHLGRLPWQGLVTSKKSRHMDLIKHKKMTSKNDLCKSIPIEFSTYLKYCWSLKIDTEPDYTYLKNIFNVKINIENYHL